LTEILDIFVQIIISVNEQLTARRLHNQRRGLGGTRRTYSTYSRVSTPVGATRKATTM